MGFIPYSQMGADQRAVKLLRVTQSTISPKRMRAIRILSNAIRHLSGQEINADNKNSVAAIWATLNPKG